MEDEPAVVVEVVVVGDVLADVPVLLRRARGVELLELELPVDDRLEEVERPERRSPSTVSYGRCHDSPTCACAPRWKTYGRSGACLQLAHEVVDRRAVREVGEVHLEPVPEMPDVVQRTARGRAHERVHRRAELDEGVREVRAHEAVGSGDEHGAALVDVAELAAEVVERAACPEGVVRHGAYASASVSKRTDSPGFGSLSERALTATSALVVTALAAIVGVVIAREFGRTDETDGFFAAYGVFIVVVLASQAIRIAVLPALARARGERRLAGEIAGFAARDRARRAVPLVLLAELADRADRRPPHGQRVRRSRRTAAAEALRWMVPAAAAHLFAGLAASGLAALDDYGTAALGYAVGSAAGLALILARVEPDGIIAVAWGMALNATVAFLVPAAGLAVRAVGAAHAAQRPRGPPASRSGLGSASSQPQPCSRSRSRCSTSSVSPSPGGWGREPSRASGTRTSPRPGS